MIEIYGASRCGYCRKAKDLCEANQVKFEYYDVDQANYKQELFDRMDVKPETIPQIFVDNKLLPGGFTALKEHLTQKAA